MAATIETYATPHRLYRYRRILDEAPGERRLERELNAIIQRFVYCPTATQMNDPMEGTHRVSAALSRAVRAQTPGLLGRVTRMRDRLGIASFAEAPDHEPMWAHYANDFAGICVAFSMSRLVAQVPDGTSFVRMSYSESAPVLRTGRRSAGEMARMVLSTKTVRWMTEREWRLISPKSGQVSYASHDCVTRVHLGHRIHAAHEDVVRREMGRVGIAVAKMTLDDYAIGFEDLTPLRPARGQLKARTAPTPARR